MAGAQVAISALPASTTVVTSDVLGLVIGGTTKKITGGNFRAQLFAFAATDPLNIGSLTAVGNSTITGTLTGITDFTSGIYRTGSAVGKFVPGVTSFAIRNNIDSADNLLITDAGVVTARGGLIVSAGSVVAAGGRLDMSSFVGIAKLLGGTTGTSIRNNADAADNLVMTDAGAITVRSSITGLTTVNTTGLITAGGGVNISGGSFAAGTIYKSAGTGLTVSCITGSGFDFQLIDPTGTTGIIRVVTGTTTVLLANALQFSATNSKIIPGATNLSHRNSSDSADNLIITDAGVVTVRAGLIVTAGNVAVTAGNLTFAAASAKLIPGATSFALRNNADSADNIGITDAGVVTVRAGLTVTAGSLTFGAATGKIIPGATSLSIRNTADSQDNFVITNSGNATLQGALTIFATLGGLTITSASGSLSIGGFQVVGVGKTGYTNAWTGTPDKATGFATSTVTLAQLAGRVMAIQTDLLAHGLISV